MSQPTTPRSVQASGSQMPADTTYHNQRDGPFQYQPQFVQHNYHNAAYGNRVSYGNSYQAPAQTTQHSNAYSYSSVHTGHTAGQVIKGQERVVSTHVIGHEYGAEKVISVNERVDESRTHIVNERVVESTMRVPKKIIREEIIEKVIVVPEKIIHEEIIEEDAIIQERIVEVAKPIIVEKIVEVPEIEIVEKVIEVPEVHIQEKLVHVPKIEVRENIVEVPKIITQEKIVEVPEIQYRDVPVERIVEVPEVRIEEVVRQVPVPQYVDKPVPEYVTVEVPEDVHRKLPVPVEAITTFEYKLPQFKPKYRKVKYPVYLPRFIEVPVAAEVCTPEMAAKIQHFTNTLQALQSDQPISVCLLENLAEEIRHSDTTAVQGANLQEAVMRAWEQGRMQLDHHGHLLATNDRAYDGGLPPVPENYVQSYY